MSITFEIPPGAMVRIEVHPLPEPDPPRDTFDTTFHSAEEWRTTAAPAPRPRLELVAS